MRGLLRLLAADSRRRKQSAHQQDGHRCAMKDASHHDLSLPEEGFFAVT
jgi:hypothetical protein